MRCEYQTPRASAGPFGWLSDPCMAERGLRRWWDELGFPHRACPAHFVRLQARYPAFDPPEPDWNMPVETVVFPDAADYLEDRWTEPELREAWGR